MIRFNSQITTADAAQRARDELGAAWEHLAAAAEHGARQVSHASRRQSTVARERAAAAALALRGQQPSPWRWLAVGAAAGFALGAAGALLLRHRVPDREEARLRAEMATERAEHTAEVARERAEQVSETARQRAGAAVETVRQRTGEAAHNAVATARETAQKVRDRLPGASGAPDTSANVEDSSAEPAR